MLFFPGPPPYLSEMQVKKKKYAHEKFNLTECLPHLEAYKEIRLDFLAALCVFLSICYIYIRPEQMLCTTHLFVSILRFD